MTEPKELSDWEVDALLNGYPEDNLRERLRAHIAALEANLAERDALVRDAAYLVAHRNHCEGSDMACAGCQWLTRAREDGIIKE